jgi:hypothetical protein
VTLLLLLLHGKETTVPAASPHTSVQQASSEGGLVPAAVELYTYPGGHSNRVPGAITGFESAQVCFCKQCPNAQVMIYLIITDGCYMQRFECFPCLMILPMLSNVLHNVSAKYYKASGLAGLSSKLGDLQNLPRSSFACLNQHCLQHLGCKHIPVLHHRRTSVGQEWQGQCQHRSAAGSTSRNDNRNRTSM